jgi:membrane-associated protease RseP (regulator of RpoE activity)
MRRTKRFGDMIDWVAQLSPRFWRIVGTFGIVICIYLMFYGVNLLFNLSNYVLSGYIEEPAFQLILPIPSVQSATGPGFIGIPFWFWIITVAFILVPHEFFHGIMARADKVKLKSVGLILFAIFPGAFVEPDEKQLARKKLLTRLRVFAAGSFTNIMIAILIVNATQVFLWEPAVAPGVMIGEIIDGTAAEAAGLKPGMIIEEIDGSLLRIGYADYSYIMINTADSMNENITIVSASHLLGSRLLAYEPGDEITLTAEGREYNIVLGQNPEYEELPYLGVRYPDLNVESKEMFFSAFPLLAFIWLLSMAVAIVNILPMYPLDGGLMLKAVTDEYLKKNSDAIVKGVAYFILFLLLFNFFGPVLLNL